MLIVYCLLFIVNVNIAKELFGLQYTTFIANNVD